jgi:hypothetical protein
MLRKHILCYKFFFFFLIYLKIKLRLKCTIIDKTLTCASENRILTNRDRKQINIFEKKVHRRILGQICENEK